MHAMQTDYGYSIILACDLVVLMQVVNPQGKYPNRAIVMVTAALKFVM